MNSTDPPVQYISGKLVISVVVVVGIAAASFAWGFRHFRTDQVLDFWGGENAAMIRDPESTFELWLLSPDSEAAADPSSRLLIEGEAYRIEQKKTITAAPGILHGRESLLDDFNYDWKREPKEGTARAWHYLLYLRGENGDSLRAAIDNTTGRLLNLNNKQEVFFSPKMANGWRIIFKEHFEKPSNENQ